MEMSQLGGLDDVKSILKRYIEWPLKYSARFRKLGVPVPKGFLQNA
jgi:SpoVK/Ycf46/Vps4 family AAA+-type ATPase